MIPHAASMVACAFDPAISCRYIRLSKSIEALIACISSDGPLEKRPPQMLDVPSPEWVSFLSVIWHSVACEIRAAHIRCRRVFLTGLSGYHYPIVSV